MAGTASVQVVGPAPTIVQAIGVNGGAAVTGRTAALSVLGSGPGGASALVYDWTVAAAPPGGVATFSINDASAASNTTATFNEAGSYTFTVTIIDAGLSVSSTKTVVATSTLSGIRLVTPGGQMVNYPATLNVTGASQTIVAQGLDQFGAVMAAQPGFIWTATPLTGSTPSPGLTTSANTATLAFTKVGVYALNAQVANDPYISAVAELIVTPTLTSIRVTPNTASLGQGAAQLFAASGYDQFQNVVTTQPTFTWSDSGGTITSGGLFTAPGATGTCTITARSGSVTGTATVQVTSGAPQNTSLASLVASLDAAGSFTRLDMIQILDYVVANGAVTAAELSELKTVVGEAATLHMPNYVQVLASDVINGNAANATYQGAPLGNLAVGSSAAQLTDLIDKWFYGTDLPTLTSASLVYKSAAGSLFPHTPSNYDEYQGELGDCYFISSLGTLADSNPAAIENMIINNGDGTYTVRFYTGPYGQIYTNSGVSDGFTNDAGVADYVTVNSMLPATSSGQLVYADYGASCANPANSLWIPLIEKAYAQWDQTGKEGPYRSGVDSYADIQGGWMATVYAQVLGYNAADYAMATTSEQTAINALAAGEAVTIGTTQWSTTNEYATEFGLYQDHAYAIIGYTASSNTFTLYNPWGFDQPGQLTWSELQTACTGFCVASTAGTVPIGGAPGGAAAGKVSASLGGWGAAAAEPLSAAVWTFAQVDDAAAAVPSGPASAASATFAVFQGMENSGEARLHQPHHAARASTVLSPSLVNAALQSLPALV